MTSDTASHLTNPAIFYYFRIVNLYIKNLNKLYMNVEIANETLTKQLMIVQTQNEILNKQLMNLTIANENLKNELMIVKSDNENLRNRLMIVEKDNEILTQNSLHITAQKRYQERNAVIRNYLNGQLSSVSKLKPNRTTQDKMFTIVSELLRRGEIPYTELQKRFWKTKQNRARALSLLYKLGYVQLKKRQKKHYLAISPKGKSLEATFDAMLGK